MSPPDIEVYVERRLGGRWHFHGRMIPNPELEFGSDEEVPSLVPEPAYQAASRKLAALLTGRPHTNRPSEQFVPIVPPRGVPADASPELAAFFAWRFPVYDDEPEVKSWLRINWFTAREVLEFGWDERTTRRRIFVDPRVVHLFDGCPRGFPLDRWPPELPVWTSEYGGYGIAVE